MVVIPPFAGTTTGAGETITMAGLSMPLVREADVFSEVSQGSAAEPAETVDPLTGPATTDRDVFAEEVAKSLPKHSLTGMSEELDAAAPAPFTAPKRPRGRGGRPGVPMTGPRPATAFADEEAMAAAAQHPRKLMRRVLVLLLVMIGLIGATWAGVYQFVPVRTKLQAMVTYKRFEKLTQREQRIMQAEQVARLNEEATRNLALHKLQELHPGTAPGFIASPEKYDVIEALWPGEPHNGQLFLRYDSTDPQTDKLRLEAVARALYAANSNLVEDARAAIEQNETLLHRKESDESKLNQLATEVEGERELVDKAPSQVDLDKLKHAEEDLASKRDDAQHQLDTAQAELEKLKTQQAGAASAADPAKTDVQLQQMTRDADALNSRLTEARKGRADMAAQARATLDTAYDDFTKQLDSVQGAAKDNPQLATYFTAAQNLQQEIRELTDHYIQHQQQDYTALSELKNNFIAKMTDRKATLLANDPKLKDMSEQKEIKTRLYNEAVNSGLDKEAGDLKAELKQLDLLLKTQQELVSNDPVYNDFITGLQQMIDQKQRSINEEKQKTDEKLASLRQSFNKSATGVQNLPAEQKELATTMRDKLAAIDAARKQYAEASDAAAADADTNIKQISDDLQTLQTNIEARKKQLAAANTPERLAAADNDRQAQLAAQTKTVDDLTQALASAKTAYDAKHAEFAAKSSAFAVAQIADQKLNAATQQIETIKQTQTLNNLQLATKKDQADRAVEPIEPTAADVKALDNPVDNRFAIAGFSSLGIFVLFAVGIVFTILSAVRASQHTYTPAFESLETPAVPKLEEEEAAVA